MYVYLSETILDIFRVSVSRAFSSTGTSVSCYFCGQSW